MRRKANFNARFREDNSGLTGLPLRIFIMVVIAGVCLVVILGFLVVSKPDLDTIHVEPIMINGWEHQKIWCNWTEDTNKTAVPDIKPGEHWYAGIPLSYGHRPDPYLYDPTITITCIGSDDKPMADVDIVISGAGVNDGGTTDSNGKIVLSLKGCHLGANDRNGKINIEAEYGSTFGTQTKTSSLTILAGDIAPDLGEYA